MLETWLFCLTYQPIRRIRTFRLNIFCVSVCCDVRRFKQILICHEICQNVNTISTRTEMALVVSRSGFNSNFSVEIFILHIYSSILSIFYEICDCNCIRSFSELQNY